MRALPPPGTRIACYARYSTQMQRFKSIEDQLALCREYAKKHGWIIVAEYHDAERSGTTLVGRSGFYSLMAAADRGEFELMLIEDLDRMSRTASDTHGIAEDLEFLDIHLCAVNSGMVTDMEIAFRAIQNAQYARQSAEKTRRGQEGTVRSGRISGSVAYGYRKLLVLEGTNGLREINPDEEWVVIRIFRDYVSGMSPLAICIMLNEEGVPGPRGKPWQPGALVGNAASSTGILRNTMYIGRFEWGRTSRKRNHKTGQIKTRSTPKSERVVVDIPHLRIIEDELFQAAQDRLASRSTGPVGTHRHADFLFSRLIECGVCGSPFVVLSKRLGCTGRSLKGICSNRRRVPREDFEQAILDGLKDRLLAPEIIGPCLAEYRAEAERAAAEHTERMGAGQRRLAELERHKENILRGLREGDSASLAGQALMQELERLEAERQRLEKDARRPPPIMASEFDPEKLVARLHEQVDNLREALSGPERDAVRARHLIRSLITKIKVSPIEVEKEDGRGSGPVRITVEGPLAELVGLADAQVGRAILHGSRTQTMQDDSKLTFRYYVDIDYKNPRLACGVYADLPIVSRLLDDADAPVHVNKFMRALAGHGRPFDKDAKAELRLRVRRTLTYLESRGEARAVQAGLHSGWVWSHVPYTDEEWKERASRPKPEGYELPVIRMSGPAAHVVVIGPGEKEGRGGS